MITWLFIIVACIIVYLSWYIALSSWTRLSELGVEHNRSFISFFDGIAQGGIYGLIISRFAWIVMHLDTFTDVPWGILPYTRTASGTTWFLEFPWRVLRIDEGISYPILWGVWGILVALLTFVPTMQLASRLKVDKHGVQRGFMLRALGGMFIVLLFTVGAVYSSL